MSQLHKLLDTKCTEADVQKLFEARPEAICGSLYVMNNAVIRKFPLGRDHATDFTYVNPQSGQTFIYLIEIESPSKKIFNKDDSFTPELSQALQQVNDWLVWCSLNDDALSQQLEPLRRRNGDCILHYVPRGILIYGREEEINSARRNERWLGKVKENPFISIRTYDGWNKEHSRFLSDNRFDIGVRSVVYQRRDYSDLQTVASDI